MTRRAERRKAIALRKEGKTYSEIRQELGIAKSTLSDWLSDFQLTKQELLLLEKNRKKNKHIATERTRSVKHFKRQKRLLQSYEEQSNAYLPLSHNELFLAGLFLYWGEGAKNLKGPLSISNTDPKVLKFSLYWLTKSLDVPREKVRVYLQLYKDMNVREKISYWSNELDIPASQFSKPYIKESKRIEIDHKGFGHGTCTIAISNILLKEKVMMGIKAIADHYSDTLRQVI